MLQKGLIKGMSLGLVALLLSGCFHAAELAQVRADIEREMPEADFDKEVELTLGPMTLGFVRLLTAFAPFPVPVGSVCPLLRTGVVRAQGVPPTLAAARTS